MNTKELIMERKSTRTFSGRPLSEEDRSKILGLAGEADNPYGIQIEYRILDAKADNLSSPVISGADFWLAGKMKRCPHAEEAFGYSFEKLLLSAVEAGFGTVWMAGTMDRKAFENAMDLKEDEVLPCVSPIGYPAANRSFREKMMRLGVRADSRQAFSSLFFEENFNDPLSPVDAGTLVDVFEMIRWAPSAVNRQPWRVVLSAENQCAHFYEVRSKNYADAAGWDIRKIDIGIAMRHFTMGMESLGYKMDLLLEDPGLEHPEDIEYIATWNWKLE